MTSLRSLSLSPMERYNQSCLHLLLQMTTITLCIRCKLLQLRSKTHRLLHKQSLLHSLSALQQDSNFSGILGSYSDDITSAQNDLQSEQQATDCSDKKYYEQAVEYDASQVSGPTSDDSRFNNLYLSSAENDIQAIKQASQILNQPMPDISQAQNAINSAKAKVAGYDSQIQQIVAQAKAALGQC
jgi:hypothetical protein